MFLRGEVDGSDGSRPLGISVYCWQFLLQADIRSGGLPANTEAVVNLSGENLMNPMRRYDSFNTVRPNDAYIHGLVQDCSISSVLAMEIYCSFALNHRYVSVN